METNSESSSRPDVHWSIRSVASFKALHSYENFSPQSSPALLHLLLMLLVWAMIYVLIINTHFISIRNADIDQEEFAFVGETLRKDPFGWCALSDVVKGWKPTHESL